MTNWTIFFAVEGGLFNFDATLPVMALQFVILIILLNSVFYKPLGKAIDERANYIRQNLVDARERKQKSEKLAKQYEQELREVRKQSQDIIAAAQADAQQIVASQVKEAQQQVLAERQKAAEEIEAQKVSAFSSLEAQVEALSDQILTKLLGAQV
jgi:F-type H+-transporting ATPase subunit b